MGSPFDAPLWTRPSGTSRGGVVRDRIREARRLAAIARQLAADDPQLAEAFQLWNERCGGVPARMPGWMAGSGPAAAVVITLRGVLGRLLRR